MWPKATIICSILNGSNTLNALRMMHFREVSVTTQNAFSQTKHLKHKDVLLSSDLDGKHYACLDLPSANSKA
jgi:hypothetical protein